MPWKNKDERSVATMSPWKTKADFQKKCIVSWLVKVELQIENKDKILYQAETYKSGASILKELTEAIVHFYKVYNF